MVLLGTSVCQFCGTDCDFLPKSVQPASSSCRYSSALAENELAVPDLEPLTQIISLQEHAPLEFTAIINQKVLTFIQE